MAKKRGRAKAAAGRAAAVQPVACDQPVAGASRTRAGAFCCRSSKGAPFLVVSDRQLVGGLPAPCPQEWGDLLALCNSLVQQWTARGAVVLADFEGEFTGLEGELVTAAFQRTLALDPKSLRPLLSGSLSLDTGLLVDLRCEAGASLAKRVMESEVVTKVIWGADGDLASLRYTPPSRPLGVQACCVVDAQLAFSSTDRRLSMARMLERVPPKSIAALPDKGSLDFDTAHAANRRALPLPLTSQAATYAVDDLHRLEAVLLSQKPADGSYLRAQSQTAALLSRLLQNPAAFSTEKLGRYQEWLQQRTGVQKLAVALRAKRHLLALRALRPEALGDFGALEAEVDAALAAGGVPVQADLSFCGDALAAPAVPQPASHGPRAEVADGAAPPPAHAGEKAGRRPGVKVGRKRRMSQASRGRQTNEVEGAKEAEAGGSRRAKRRKLRHGGQPEAQGQGGPAAAAETAAAETAAAEAPAAKAAAAVAAAAPARARFKRAGLGRAGAVRRRKRPPVDAAA